MKSFRGTRVIPVRLAAVFGLAVLKVPGLVIDGGYVFEYRSSELQEAPKESLKETLKETPKPQPPSPPQPAKKSWAQDVLGFPGGAKVAAKPDSDDITGSVPAPPKEPPKPAAPAAANPPPSSGGRVVIPDQNQQHAVSPSERAILERLQ